MARRSGMGAPVIPERTPEGAESEAVTNEEGSFIDTGRKGNNKHRQTTQHSSDATTDKTNNAMGQGESVESRQERSATIRAASQMAAQSNSKKRGTLPSYSKPQTGSGQRRLAPNPLSRPNVYDVPSDDELPRRRRHTSSARPFSPLKRHARQTSRTLEEAAREDQRLADAQLGQYQQFMQQVDDIAGDNRSAGAKIRARKESRRMRMSAERIETAQDDQAEADEEDTIEVRGSSAQPPDQTKDNDVPLDHSANAEGQDANVQQDQPIDEPLAVVKRKRGRPSKAATGGEKKPPTGEKRKRGRPSKNAAKQAESPQAAKKGSAVIHANERGELRRKSIRHAPKSSVESKGGNGDREEPPPPSKRQKQSSVRSQPALKSPDRIPEVQAIAGSQQETHATQPTNDYPQPINTSLQDNEDDENNDAEEEEAVEDDDEGEEEIDEADGELAESDEDDAGAASDEADQYRLYGHWVRLRKIVSVARKYHGAKVRIKNAYFKNLLQDCEILTNSIRATASDASTEELDHFVSRCTSILKRSRKICGHGDSQFDFSDKKLGFHIFKHLFPALALLLYAIVRGFESLDVEAAGNQQISLEHLRTVLDIMVATRDSEKSAHDGFLKLSENANKRKVHEGIAIPLRTILDSLSRVHRSEIAERQARAAREEAVRDVEAQTQEMERRARHRKFSDANHSHWNHLNLMRVRVANTFNRKKLLHLRSCPASIVETKEDGMPYLRDQAHAQQAQWTMPELAALQNCLKNFPDNDRVPPCQSKVFETVIDKACRPGGALADRNVLEIVVTANEMKDNFIRMRLERDEDVELWLERIPQWIEPRQGTSAEDAIEV